MNRFFSSSHTALTARGLAEIACTAVIASAGLTADAATNNVTIFDLVEGSIMDTNGDGTPESVSFVGPSEFIRAYSSSVRQEYAVVEFDLSALGTQPIEIQEATLRLQYRLGSGSPTETLQFYSFAGNGAIELSDTHISNLTTIGPPQNAFGPGPGPFPRYYEIDVASHLQTRVDDGDSHAGFAAANLSFNQTLFGGSLWPYPPELVVAYNIVPMPSALAMGALGLLVVSRRRRR